MFLRASDRLGIIAASADEMPVLGHINEDHPSRASTYPFLLSHLVASNNIAVSATP